MDVKVPGQLLRVPGLTPSAKLLWMLLQVMHRPHPALLEVRSGLSRQSVLRGLAQLQGMGSAVQAGMEPDCPGRAGSEVALVSGDLICDRQVSVQGRLLYAHLLLEFGSSRGTFTYPELAARTGRGPNTLKAAIGDLQAHGWIQTTQESRVSPIRFVLRNPAAERREAEVRLASRRIERSEHVGEQIMREFLSLLIDCDEFEDDSAPGFLLNPLSGERLQYDRYYPPRVGFEFNGPQHYGPTDRYPDPEKAPLQQARDYMKLGMSAARGMTVVIVHAEDLSLTGIQQKVGGLLPLRNLDDHEPLVEYLETVGRRYRAKVAREERAARTERNLTS